MLAKGFLEKLALMTEPCREEAAWRTGATLSQQRLWASAAAHGPGHRGAHRAGLGAVRRGEGLMRDNIEPFLARGDKLDELERRRARWPQSRSSFTRALATRSGGAVVERQVWAGGGDGGDGGRRGDDAGDRRRRRVEFMRRPRECVSVRSSRVHFMHVRRESTRSSEPRPAARSSRRGRCRASRSPRRRRVRSAARARARAPP